MTDFWGNPRPVPDDLARAAVKDCGIDPPPDVIADARCFSDKIPEVIGHVGAHAKFLQMLARDRRFPNFIRVIRDKIEDTESFRRNSYARPLHISVFCRAGEMRSVGCAILLSHCLEVNGFRMVRNINFMTKRFWRRCSCQGSCQWCWISGPQQLCDHAVTIRENALHEAEIHYGN